jgi:hypothetical protein
LLDDVIARRNEHQALWILFGNQSRGGRNSGPRAPNAWLDQEPGRPCAELTDLPQCKIAMIGVNYDERLGVLLRAETLNRLLK